MCKFRSQYLFHQYKSLLKKPYIAKKNASSDWTKDIFFEKLDKRIGSHFDYILVDMRSEIIFSDINFESLFV